MTTDDVDDDYHGENLRLGIASLRDSARPPSILRSSSFALSLNSAIPRFRLLLRLNPNFYV